MGTNFNRNYGSTFDNRMMNRASHHHDSAAFHLDTAAFHHRQAAEHRHVGRHEDADRHNHAALSHGRWAWEHSQEADRHGSMQADQDRYRDPSRNLDMGRGSDISGRYGSDPSSRYGMEDGEGRYYDRNYVDYSREARMRGNHQPDQGRYSSRN